MISEHRHAHAPARSQWVTSAFWIAGAILIALLIVRFGLRSHNVVGSSMEPTLSTGDVVFVNRLGRTIAAATNGTFMPKRGQIIVFQNPLQSSAQTEAYIVKRVVGLPGDHITIRDGRMHVYSPDQPNTAIDTDKTSGLYGATSGSVDRIVPDDELFVVGDNRQGNNSLDSRNGLSTIPADTVEGTVILRFWPLNHIKLY